MLKTFTNNDLLTFFLLTFGISWGLPGVLFVAAQNNPNFEFSLELYSPLYYLVVWSPALSALIAIAKRQGPGAIILFIRRLFHWQVGLRWYSIALVLIPALYLSAGLLMWATGEQNAFGFYEGTLIQFLFGAILLRATAGPLEELGWRGFALPILQRKYSGLVAAILVGAIWGIWHMPSFVIGSLYQSTVGLPLVFSVPIFIVQTIAMSIILSVLYNGTNGSLLLVFLLHLSGNIQYPWEGSVEMLPAQTLMLSAAAVVLIAIFRGRFLGRKNLHKAVVELATGQASTQ